ncbi:beta-N-acetylhexosaminidase [Salinisphaera sp. SPP-AMP-43]|uniref:beta-N-acetylhexosaminidase n=1 Tax=Salinisphaera sp. SPP-AMP-43 TaxID=3121288 RepID=UPI003C6E6E77
MIEMSAPGPLLVDIEGTELTAADRQLLGDPAVGGVILFTRNYRNPQQLFALTEAMRAARPNLLIVADYEGGRVQRFRDGFTPIPPMQSLGRVWLEDPAAARSAAAELAWLVAMELADVGIDMPLAPVADLDYGNSEVIGSRAFGEAPAAVAELAIVFARALAEAGSPATAKHFPGHGYVVADSHAELPVDERPIEALAEDWAPFADLIDQGVASVMMAHVRYPAVDDRPASLSKLWIEDILRAQLGFAGCVFCDDLSMGAAASLGDYAERVRAALDAGCDYLPVCNDREAALAACATVAGCDADRGTSRRQALQARVAPRPRVADDERRRQAARETAAQLMGAA